MCVIAFIEGILFSFFCFELLQEQFESIEDNQTYVDDMKETFGKPRSTMENLLYTLGLDWAWWLLPTRPVLKINYLEKLYTLKMLKKMKEFEDDDFDESKKMLFHEKRLADIEKKIFGAICITIITVWFSYGRHVAQSWIDSTNSA